MLSSHFFFLQKLSSFSKYAPIVNVIKTKYLPCFSPGEKFLQQLQFATQVLIHNSIKKNLLQFKKKFEKTNVKFMADKMLNLIDIPVISSFILILFFILSFILPKHKLFFNKHKLFRGVI